MLLSNSICLSVCDGDGKNKRVNNCNNDLNEDTEGKETHRGSLADFVHTNTYLSFLHLSFRSYVASFQFLRLVCPLDPLPLCLRFLYSFWFLSIHFFLYLHSSFLRHPSSPSFLPFSFFPFFQGFLPIFLTKPRFRLNGEVGRCQIEANRQRSLGLFWTGDLSAGAKAGWAEADSAGGRAANEA